MKKNIDFQKLKYIVPTASLALLSSSAFAANPVTEAIGTEVASLKTDAGVVIASAVGLGLVFWGAKLLFGKFKGMAK